METERKVELIEREYWSCRYPNHRHRTEYIAEACIDKTAGIKTPRKIWSREELFNILEKRNACSNKAELARELGMSPQNLQRLAENAEWIQRWERDTGEIEGANNGR